MIPVFFSLSVFLSCAALPVNQAREKFVSLNQVTPQWQEFVSGIDYFHGKTTAPRLEFWVLRIDLVSPQIHIVVRGGDADNRSTKVSSFVRDNGLTAGINALPFDPVSGREGEARINVGIVVSEGKMISPPDSRFDALVWYSDGSVSIVSQAAIQSAENIENAVGGFNKILADCEPAERTLSRKERHPRSAAGISANGEYLYLLVIDGRRPGSIGSTEEETALLLRSLGSWDGINFDGGGSSALVLRFPNGRVRAVNTPIHRQIPGKERAVAGCIGVEAIGLSQNP